MIALWLIMACRENLLLPLPSCGDPAESRVSATHEVDNGLTAEQIVADAMASSNHLRVDWDDGLEPAVTHLMVEWTAAPEVYFDWSDLASCDGYLGVGGQVAVRITDEGGALVAEGPAILDQGVREDIVSDTLIFVDLAATLPVAWPNEDPNPRIVTSIRDDNQKSPTTIGNTIRLGGRECLAFGCVTWVR